jgi:hypothetical protein
LLTLIEDSAVRSLYRACLVVSLLAMFLCTGALIGGLLLFQFAPQVILTHLDFEARGLLEDFWADRRFAVDVTESAPAPRRLPTRDPLPALLLALPTAALQPAQPTPLNSPDLPVDRLAAPIYINLYAEGYVDVTVPTDQTFAESFAFVRQPDDAVTAAFAFREKALTQICSVWLNDCQMPLARLESVDFRQDGVIVYGSVFLGAFWQTLGVILVPADGGQGVGFALGGVVIDGKVYRVPRTGAVADALSDLLDRANRALDRLTLRTPNYTLALRQIALDDRLMTLLWK